MKQIKDELQSIIFGDGQPGEQTALKKVQTYLRRYAETGFSAEKQQRFRSEETTSLIKFVSDQNLWYIGVIDEAEFISEGAEQRVYRLNDFEVIKTNAAVFYERWLDYFNSLLIHNYFFPSTHYHFFGFVIKDSELQAVVKQDFIKTTEHTDLFQLKQFLNYNGFKNTRNNDYYSQSLGLILEDLHDENVITNNGILFFIDTIFYLAADFY